MSDFLKPEAMANPIWQAHLLVRWGEDNKQSIAVLTDGTIEMPEGMDAATALLIVAHLACHYHSQVPNIPTDNSMHPILKQWGVPFIEEQPHD